MSDIIFTTDRLTIRPLTLGDLADFYTMQSNPKVMQYVKSPLNHAETKAELAKFIGYYSDPVKFYKIWAVTRGNKFIGICGVYQNQQSDYELAYRLTESAWGNGYGSEIAVSLIHHSLSKLLLQQLVAYVYAENIPSVKILDKYMNFKEETIHKTSGMKVREYSISIVN